MRTKQLEHFRTKINRSVRGSLSQTLNRGRYRHSSIVQNDFIIHSGGNGNFFMEIWELDSFDENGIPSFTIYDSITTLQGWHSYPYVFPMELL